MAPENPGLLLNDCAVGVHDVDMTGEVDRAVGLRRSDRGACIELEVGRIARQEEKNRCPKSWQILVDDRCVRLPCRAVEGRVVLWAEQQNSGIGYQIGGYSQEMFLGKDPVRFVMTAHRH